MNESENTVDLSEVYFLIAHFLADSPLTSALASAAQVLKEELERKKLLPKRIDWHGVEQEQKFSDVAATHGDVASSHLVSLLGTLNTLLNRHGYTALPGLNSLLTLSAVSKVKRGGGVKLVSTVSRVARLGEFHLSHYNAMLGKNYLPSLLTTQYCSRLAGKNLLTPSFFATAKKFTSILGHLAPVYCCTYDRTGHRIITGADDCLLKIWSSHDGRLLGTLRGHSGEVSDIALSHNNTLIASGSTDKTIRVWCAQTTAPVAVLTGHHGIITSLQFSPIMYEDSHGILTSTSSDGHLFMWSYNTATNEFDKTPTKIMEKTRVGDQTVCSGYSPGGYYLVTGGTDHVIRIYKMYPTPIMEPWELTGHTDRIMIVKFGHTTSSLLATGSRDGTARIWCYKAGQWTSTMLQMPKPVSEEDVCHRHKLQVTMVGWDWTDHYIITASTPDCNMYVWDVNTATITCTLQGHMGEVFVVEPHPRNIRILLSAGHDGLVKLWDMFTGTCIKTFRNLYIEEESESSVFDCRFSPDGLTFAATDALGHVILFGFGDKWTYRKFPDEQFFHTDYRPLIWDRDNNVLDEQSQRPPHLMPPPYLVDIDGHPHPLKGQQGILELIRPPSKLNFSKGKEEVDIIVDYDEFMKQRQVQLAANKKQLTKVDMNCLLKTGKNSYVPQNDKDIANGDQPCCSSSAGSQLFSQSQESNVTMETSQTDSSTSVLTCKTNSMTVTPAIMTNTAHKISLSNGDITPVQTTVNGFNTEGATVNGHSEINVKQLSQNSKNTDQDASFCQNGQLDSHKVIKDQASVNFSTDFVNGQKQLDNDQATISDQTAIANDQTAVNNQATINSNDQETVNHQVVVNTQAEINDQVIVNNQAAISDHVAVNDQAAFNDKAAVNDQASVNNQLAVNDQVAVHDQSNNDEINIIEFDNSEDAAASNNSNMLSSIVWSCGLSDEEAKNAVTMWSSRTVIPHLDPEVYGLQQSKLDYQLNEEIKYFERESLKAAAMKVTTETIKVDSSHPTTRAQGKSLRSGKRLPDVTGFVTEMLADEDNVLETISVSDSEEDDGFNHWTSNEGSYFSSSDVSDWTTEAAINITSLGRKSTRRHRTRLHNSSGGEEFNEVIDEDPGPSTTTEADLKSKRKLKMGNNKYSAFLPTNWLKQTTRETSPYFPQVGDMVIYCRQGHEMYLQEVRQKRLNYHVKGQKLPWQKYSLEPHELCQVKNVHFIVGPPTVCSITLSLVPPHDAATSSVPKTFSFKYHDIDDVPDFLILASHFCSSICHPWKEGKKFQSYIENHWWVGKIISREPFSPIYPQSLWQCYIVQWEDDNITDTLSPWDMEPTPDDEDTSPDMTNLELFSWRYVEQEDEWVPNGIEAEIKRIHKGIEVVMETMEEAAPFKEPVDLGLYPDYCVAVAMPTDLSTIKTKLIQKFYPRKIALLWEVILLYRNTLAYNEDASLIVKHAKILVQTLHTFISDSSCEDVMSCYQPDKPVSDADIVINNPSPLAVNDEEASEEIVRPKRSRILSVEDSDDECSHPKRSKDEPEWVSYAHHLLSTISSHHCAIPFLEPVDTCRFPDYSHYVKQPMDLSTVLMKLESSQYTAPADFIQDIRLIFNNSRLYNTHPKDQIHQMTIKLEDYFEEHVVRFLTQCGGSEIKYATRGAINKVASSTTCGPVTKRKISSSNNEDELEEENDEAEEDEEEELEDEEEYDVEEDEDDVKAELLSLCDDNDDEISVEGELRNHTTPRKSPRKRQRHNNTNGTPMKLRDRSYLRGKQRHKSSSTFSNSSDSENDLEEAGGSYGKGKNPVIITSHGRRVKPNTRLKQ